MNLKDFFNNLSTVFAQISVSKVIGAVVLFVVLIVISKCLARIMGKILAGTKLGAGFAGFITTIAKYAMYFVSILIVCDFLGLPVTSLLAVFSLFGLAISLSVQGLLSNLMSGFTVHTLKPFSVGDFIETDVSGTVKNIGLFYTELTTPDNKKVFIPNEKVMADKLINYSSEPTRRIDLVFNAGYEHDAQIVKNALKEAVESVDLILKDPDPVIGVSEYADSTIKYTVMVWVETANYFPAKFALMEAVSQSYNKNGIKMAYNRLEVKMVNGERKDID